MIKSILGGKSKNLFQSSDEVGVLNGGLGPNVARNFEENKWYIGLTSNNYYIPSNIKEYSIKDDLIYFKRDSVNSNGYGLARAIKCEPSTTYTVSLEPIYVAGYYAINIGYFDKDGNLISNNNITGTSKTITTPNNCNWLVLVFNFYDIYSSGKGEVYFGYIQLELGSTATEYVPHELTSYKSIMKVSDVCQLVDPKYIHTIVDRGVTFTSNGDGSVTVNGTPTGEYYSLGTIALDIKAIKPNHKYVVYDVNRAPIISELIIASYQGGYIYKGIGNISTYPEHPYTRFVFEIRVNLNQTANNIVVHPQLFDLTEMFGSGHEPKTVAEFKAKFPNDYYPYSPSCFVTSFDERMPCKTKNLFDVNNAVPYIFNNDNPDGNLIRLKDGIYTTRINNYNVGSGLRIKNGLSLPAGTYTVSAKIVDFYNIKVFSIGFRYKDTESKWHYVNTYAFPNRVGVGDTVAFRYDIPEHTDLRLYLNYQTNDGVYLTGYVSYKDIQLEQGSTATDYVPYGYV